jgi:hypothetical protein
MVEFTSASETPTSFAYLRRAKSSIAMSFVRKDGSGLGLGGGGGLAAAAAAAFCAAAAAAAARAAAAKPRSSTALLSILLTGFGASAGFTSSFLKNDMEIFSAFFGSSSGALGALPKSNSASLATASPVSRSLSSPIAARRAANFARSKALISAVGFDCVSEPFGTTIVVD